MTAELDAESRSPRAEEARVSTAFLRSGFDFRVRVCEHRTRERARAPRVESMLGVDLVYALRSCSSFL